MAEHGSVSSYRQGCRCGECRAEVADAHRQYVYRNRAAAKGGRHPSPDCPHGTYGGYSNWSCRCTECKEAARTRNREAWRRRLREFSEDPSRFKHGRRGTYSLGCRCGPCVEAERARSRRRGPLTA